MSEKKTLSARFVHIKSTDKTRSPLTINYSHDVLPPKTPPYLWNWLNWVYKVVQRHLPYRQLHWKVMKSHSVSTWGPNQCRSDLLVPTWQAECVWKCKFLQNRFILVHVVTQYEVAVFKLCMSPGKKKDRFSCRKSWRALEVEAGVLSKSVVDLFILPVNQSDFIWMNLMMFQYSQHPFHLQRQLTAMTGWRTERKWKTKITRAPCLHLFTVLSSTFQKMTEPSLKCQITSQSWLI